MYSFAESYKYKKWMKETMETDEEPPVAKDTISAWYFLDYGVKVRKKGTYALNPPPPTAWGGGKVH